MFNLNSPITVWEQAQHIVVMRTSPTCSSHEGKPNT